MSEDIVRYETTNSNPLIPTANHSIGDTQQTTVTGRDLHAFLGAKRDYSTWVKAQMKRGRFVEGRDYGVFTQKGENLQGGRPVIEYIFTIDAAKQIGMLSGTERGVQIREYFLACEKRVYQLESPPQPIPYVELEDPILRDMAQLNRILDQLIPMDAMRRNVQIAMLKEKHGMDFSAVFVPLLTAYAGPDPKNCVSIVELLGEKLYHRPEKLWPSWLVRVGVMQPLEHPEATPELTPAGKEIAFIDWTRTVIDTFEPVIKMDRDAFERLHIRTSPGGRTYNDNHGW